MMVFVIGGSASGKSAYAEQLAVSLAQRTQQKKYYLATMKIGDEESRQRAAHHRELRSGKGFITIEQPVAIHRSLETMVCGEKLALLECLSNLVANEMFSEENPKTEKQVVQEILASISLLNQGLTQLVIVGNLVFADGILYPEPTRSYLRAMGRINQEIAAMADKAVEVVAGIPITVKP